MGGFVFGRRGLYLTLLNAVDLVDFAVLFELVQVYRARWNQTEKTGAWGVAILSPDVYYTSKLYLTDVLWSNRTVPDEYVTITTRQYNEPIKD